MNQCKNIELSQEDYINELEKLSLDQQQGLITEKQFQKKLNKLNTKTTW